LNSRVVNKAIKAIIKPLLKEYGFTKFTARNSWRLGEHQIDVLNFQSFNSYLADRIGSTTYSIAVNLGCYITVIPELPTWACRQENGYLLPQEYACHFRRQLLKSIKQPELERKDIWYVDPEGKYLDAPWFVRFTKLSDVYTLLLGEEHFVNGTWGLGAKGSPIRNYLTGYVALALGDYKQAIQALQRAIESGCYEYIRPQVERTIKLAESSLT
jgi:hypothetical protein